MSEEPHRRVEDISPDGITVVTDLPDGQRGTSIQKAPNGLINDL